MQTTQQSYKTLTSYLVGLLISALVLQVHAESNDQLGRLFSKPNERNNLNVLRHNQKLKTISAQEALKPDVITEAAPVELPEPITLQGYVKRSDGASTLWINNKAVQEESTVDKVQVGRLNQSGFSKKGASTEGVDVRIPANGKRVRLKAGQMYEPESNQIKELQVVEKAKRLNLEQSGTIDGSVIPNRNSFENNAE